MKKILVLHMGVLALLVGTSCKSINTASGLQMNQDMPSNETANVAEDDGNANQTTNSNRINTVESKNGSTGGNANVYDAADTNTKKQNSNFNQVSAIESTNGSTGGNANLYTNGTNAVASDIDYSEMYTAIEMTDNQIRDFETEMENFKNMQKNTANGEMMGTLSTERDRQLESILTSEQLEKYQDWKDAN